MIGRRGFLGFLGIGAVSVPATAKHIAANTVGADMWKGGIGLEALQVAAPLNSQSPSLDSIEDSEETTQLANLIQQISTVGLPDWVPTEKWRQARPTYLDVDLAVNRSMSLAYKLAAQQRRNFDRDMGRLRVEKLLQRQVQQAARRKFGWWI